MADNSGWQQRVEGLWQGLPAVFDAAGQHQGFIRVRRWVEKGSSGQPAIRVTNEPELSGPLLARLAPPDLLLYVSPDGGPRRVYVGRDFTGMGRPLGSLLLGNDYIHPWEVDTSVIVQVLPDGCTQAYSALLYQGPALLGVIQGLYTLSQAGEAADGDRVEAFIANERQRGPQPQTWPAHQRGAWRGEATCMRLDQEEPSSVLVEILHQPLDALRCEQQVKLSGGLSAQYSVKRSRQGSAHYYQGPHLVGNGQTFGRALFTRLHVSGEALRIEGREVLLDAEGRIAVCWQVQRDGRLSEVVFGVLGWHAEGSH